MKDKHNVILIVVSSKWFNSFSGAVHHIIFLVRDTLSFLSRSSKLSHLHHHGDPSKSLQGFTSCFQILFPFVWSFFITGVLHGGSTWWLIKDLIPTRSVHRDSFQRSSSVLHLAFRSSILPPLSFEVVIYHSSFTKMRYLNPHLGLYFT